VFYIDFPSSDYRVIFLQVVDAISVVAFGLIMSLGVNFVAVEEVLKVQVIE
jgi:hypothetical protein